jgi:hypothetical protein
MKRAFVLVSAIATAGIVATAGSALHAGRSGILHVTKNCDGYMGGAGESCRITSSNIRAIEVNSRVVYAKAVGDPTPGVLDSDLVIHGPRHSNAFGHVVLDASTFTGVVTLSGGTGEFRHFHAGPLTVACPSFPDCSWDGPYSFTPHPRH